MGKNNQMKFLKLLESHFIDFLFYVCFWNRNYWEILYYKYHTIAVWGTNHTTKVKYYNKIHTRTSLLEIFGYSRFCLIRNEHIFYIVVITHG